VNTIEAPFEFEWQRGATWPWDWKLVTVRNPSLEISDYTPRRCICGRARLCRAESAAARQSLALPRKTLFPQRSSQFRFRAVDFLRRGLAEK
jgi:hypothetical protein